MVRTYEHPAPEDISLARVLFALSDPLRLSIVRKLAKGAAVNILELAPNVPKSTVTHHTRILREAGVTHTRPDGRNCWISLRQTLLDEKFPGLVETILSVKDDP